MQEEACRTELCDAAGKALENDGVDGQPDHVDQLVDRHVLQPRRCIVEVVYLADYRSDVPIDLIIHACGTVHRVHLRAVGHLGHGHLGGLGGLGGLGRLEAEIDGAAGVHVK
eukprot:15442125-Alexandrium_andersonii.AAC.1